jgi:GNAT superfamily N-acetyltransferase
MADDPHSPATGYGGDPGLAASVEPIAANAWPASIVELVDGWHLRATPGIQARRSNSVLTLGDGSEGLALEDKLALAAEFYERHGSPLRFHISPATVPTGLDGLLAERRFEIEAPVDLMVADLAEVVERAGSGSMSAEVAVALEPDESWLTALNSVITRGDGATLRRLVLDRIAPPVRYASLRDAERTVAVGMSVVDGGWLGIFSMATLPEARRRGAATAILRIMAEHGLADGATRAYLQTDRGNQPSHALYGRLGFRTAYGYHYRTRLEP